MFVSPTPLRVLVTHAALLAAALIGVASLGWATTTGWRPSVVASAPYRPCPENGRPCRVLPLGDSLTWGIGYDGGYRVRLFARAQAAGKRITFTGAMHNGPFLESGAPFPRNHEGHSGWKIAQIMSTVPRPALNTVPDVVLLHAGTNDIYAHTPVPVMADALEALLDRIEHTAPSALIVVAEILPLTDPALCDTARSYNAELTRRVLIRQARGEHLTIADQFNDFPVALLSDGVHPTRAGYERMADVWYAAIEPFLH
jgi:GDSL-like Lipase/Acylhydrolase family